MRKPRQLYTDVEHKELDEKAQRTFEANADGGIFLPWELCREMAEMALLTKLVGELREALRK